MTEDITKKVLSVTKNIMKNNTNIPLSPNNRKNQNLEEKKMDTNSNSRTSEYSQKSKNEEGEKKISPKEININDTNISLNKEQLYETFLLFQKFLSATQNITTDNTKPIKNNNNNTSSYNNDFISTLNSIKEIVSNKENINSNNISNNINNISNGQKDVNQYNLDKEKQEDHKNNNKNITSNFQKYNKNSINKMKYLSNERISLMKSNINDSKNNNCAIKNMTDKGNDKDESKKKMKKFSSGFSSEKNVNISRETLKDFKDINCSKINKKNNNESFIQNKKNSINDYSFDFTNNILDEYSYSIGDSLQIITTDIFKAKVNKNNNIDSSKIAQNCNKANRVNDINKTNYNINNNNIESARQIRINNYIEPCEEANKNLKRIKVIKNANKNMQININENSKNNKELIIEEKIKELNAETIKFREERDKVMKLKTEYEKLHEQLMKDIESFKEKKEIFEKFRTEELNKIKEEKKNLAAQSKLFNNIKMEKQSLSISNKNDKEIINNLRNYITQLKSIIKKKEEEIKLLSQKNNNANNISNYCINSYKSLKPYKDENSTKNKLNENKNKSYRNSLFIKNINNNVDKCEKGYMTNHSCSKIKYKLNNDKMNKSNSVIDINENIKINDKKGRNYVNSEENNKDYKLNSFSGNMFNSQIKINTSTNGKRQKIKLNLMPKNIHEIKEKEKEKKTKNFKHKKLNSTNFDIKKRIGKYKDEKNNSKNLNNSTYENINCIKDFSKTSSNFTRQKHKKNTKEENINFKDKILENLNQKRRSISNEKLKLKLSNDYKDELDKPLNKEEYEFIIPEKYTKLNYQLIQKNIIEDKEICIYTNNKRVITFPSGLKKEIYNDGFQLVYFINGDMKQNDPDGKSKYFFKDANTVQTTYPNGIQVFKFYNGQIEKHFPNGLKKIFFPNGKIDFIFDNKNEDNLSEKKKEQMET